MVLHRKGSSSSLSSVATDKRSNNSSLHKLADDPSSFGSMLDQLHAEQKGTIEALTSQVEFYRQREERARQELATLRRCLPLGKGDSDVTKLASENRALGDELDALRTKKSGWDRDRARLERHKRELERQLKDAKHTLAGFSQAIEQLETKMQRKEAEEHTRCLELENELQDKALECDQLQQQVENLQTASDENARLRAELQTLLGRSFSEQLSGPRFSEEINGIGDKLRGLEDDKRLQETQIQQLQRDMAAAQLEWSARTAIEGDAAQAGQREKEELLSQISSLHKEQETTRDELQTAKARLSVKDHTVLVSTLRSEVGSLKDRLRNEFLHEKDSLKTETQTLKQEITLLRGRLAEKDLAARNLENELLRGDEKQRQAEYDIRQLREQINRLGAELDQSRTKYQQLQQCRTSLVEQLDFGFKELLNDEESAASAHEELERLRSELIRIKKENGVFETERQTLTEALERVDRLNGEASTRQNEKIDELYRHLLEKEEVITSLKSAERQVALLQQEKESLEGNVTDARLRCESRVESEVRKADGLRSRIEQLEQDKQV
ncbi:hypothetical protein KRP22_012719 [Phytophthora ramorum]|nr:hypothetical protein KRP22_13931 [Phytophthora ramorum]